MRGANRGRLFVDFHAMPHTPAPDLYWESQVADRLGVSRTRLRGLRKQHLRPGEHFATTDDNAIALTPAGLALIERVLASGATKPADAKRGAAAGQPAESVPPGPPEKKRFLILRVPTHRIDQPQKKILICRELIEPAQPGPLPAERPVRVRDNSNFRAGMMLEATSIGYGMWQYLGRLPRRPGRW